MKYRKHEAKDYSRAHMRGIFAAANTPFREGDLALDEAGLRPTCVTGSTNLAIDGLFVAGKQGEFFSHVACGAQAACSKSRSRKPPARRRPCCPARTRTSTWCIELARHAEAIGADYIVVHAPVLHFHHAQDDCVREYYRYIASQVSIGIALWSHPDSGYLLSPELCAELADIENVVAIKYSVPREMYVKLTRLAGHKILVSTASEEEWFDNIVELGWQLYLCSSPPYTLQTAVDLRMRAIHRSRHGRKRDRRPARARQPQSGTRGTPQDAAARQAAMRIRNTGRNCLARSAGRCAGRWWNSPKPKRPRPGAAFETCGLQLAR